MILYIYYNIYVTLLYMTEFVKKIIFNFIKKNWKLQLVGVFC